MSSQDIVVDCGPLGTYVVQRPACSSRGCVAGLGEGPAAGEVLDVVDEAEAAFLADAERTIARLAETVQSFGKRGYFDIGSHWGEQFVPIYDQLRVLMDAGYERLTPGSPARAAFTSSLKRLNALLGHAQNDDEGAVEALVGALANPFSFAWRIAKSTALAAGEGASLYAGEAAAWVEKKAGETLATAFQSPLLWLFGIAALGGAGYVAYRTATAPVRSAARVVKAVAG